MGIGDRVILNGLALVTLMVRTAALGLAFRHEFHWPHLLNIVTYKYIAKFQL